MRALTYGAYTSAQVLARLFDASVAMSTRFDILDNNDSIVGSLPNAATDGTAPGAVIGATVTMNVDRAVKAARAAFEDGSAWRKMLPGERGRMGAKRLGENIAGLVGPAFIVPDDSIRDVRH